MIKLSIILYALTLINCTCLLQWKEFSLLLHRYISSSLCLRLPLECSWIPSCPLSETLVVCYVFLSSTLSMTFSLIDISPEEQRVFLSWWVNLTHNKLVAYLCSLILYPAGWSDKLLISQVIITFMVAVNLIKFLSLQRQKPTACGHIAFSLMQ